MRFEIIIPTYKRPEKLISLLTSIEATIQDRAPDIDIHIQFDNNDIESFNRLQRAYKNQCGLNIYYGINRTRRMVFDIWNDRLRQMKTDAVITLTDDIEFIGNGLYSVVTDFEGNCSDTDWVMSVNQENPVHRSGMVVIGRAFADRFPMRMCYYPKYNVCAGDNELWQYASSIKRTYWHKEEIVISHRHESDQTDKEAKTLHLTADRALYYERQAQGLVWGKDL